MKFSDMDIVSDPSMPTESIFLLPPDVRAAIETAQNIDVAHQKGRASRKMLDTALDYADSVIAKAAEENRIGVIKNVTL